MSSTPVPPLSTVDIRLLKVFRTITDCGGFAAAEAELNISRSTISTYISDLEARLGMRLCNRGRRGFSLTEHGQEVYDATLELLSSLEHFRTRVGNVKGELIGELSICVVDNITTSPLNPIPKTIAALNNRPGNVYLNINATSPKNVERAVLEGHAHAGITLGTEEHSGLHYRDLFHEISTLYCGQGHPLFERTPNQISIEEIQQYPHIRRGYIDDRRQEKDLELSYKATSFQIEGTLQLILSGDFIGFLPTHYVQHWQSQDLVRPLLPEQFQTRMPIRLITRKGHDQNSKLNAFIEDLVGVVEAADTTAEV